MRPAAACAAATLAHRRPERLAKASAQGTVAREGDPQGHAGRPGVVGTDGQVHEGLLSTRCHLCGGGEPMKRRCARGKYARRAPAAPRNHPLPARRRVCPRVYIPLSKVSPDPLGGIDARPWTEMDGNRGHRLRIVECPHYFTSTPQVLVRYPARKPEILMH